MGYYRSYWSHGKDADESRILNELSAKIPTPLTAEQIRDLLERLKGDERIDKSAVRGLEEELKKIREEKAGKGYYLFGGGVSKIAMDKFILDPYEPSGTKDGSNTNFTLTKAPNPTASLKVWRGGALQERGTGKDYTLSGRTITFATAPASGEVLQAEHRI